MLGQNRDLADLNGRKAAVTTPCRYAMYANTTNKVIMAPVAHAERLMVTLMATTDCSHNNSSILNPKM